MDRSPVSPRPRNTTPNPAADVPAVNPRSTDYSAPVGSSQNPYGRNLEPRQCNFNSDVRPTPPEWAGEGFGTPGNRHYGTTPKGK
jgi:hypothetical protein